MIVTADSPIIRLLNEYTEIIYDLLRAIFFAPTHDLPGVEDYEVVVDLHWGIEG